ncbi:hypothetical protein HHI36_000943 [Cryptolaemus montrouzieri]|uniref:Fucosyltransferase n=1 Tax=Cryptolaemus montrouzieri TaxID=559131 RepID=A0ABD2P6G8_9CUCU
MLRTTLSHKILIILCFLIFLAYQLIDKKVPNKSIGKSSNNISILYWTKMFQTDDFNLGFGPHIFQKCEYSNCFTTNNRSLLNIDEFSAIVFHHADFKSNDLPQVRSSKQYYIFFNLESPLNSFTKPRNDFYNWTMSYRSDSDIVHPYGYFTKRITTYQFPSIENLRKRKGKFIWMVSNCITPSKREMLVEEINKHIKVDVIGKCAETLSISCPKTDGKKCYNFIEKNYKFYLSFENSLCKDYVTEKLFNILQKNVLPIVYGSADYSNIAPPNSYINVRNYRNISEFIEYIKQLDENPELYLRYLQWKKENVIEIYPQKALCDLCKKLNEVKVYKTYKDLMSWWFSDGMCENNAKIGVNSSQGFQYHSEVI